MKRAIVEREGFRGPVRLTYLVDPECTIGDFVRIPETDWLPSDIGKVVSFDTDYQGSCVVTRKVR